MVAVGHLLQMDTNPDPLFAGVDDLDERIAVAALQLAIQPLVAAGAGAARLGGVAKMEQGLIRMSPEGFAQFMDVLSRPAAPVPEMVEVLKRPAPWEPGYAAKR